MCLNYDSTILNDLNNFLYKYIYIFLHNILIYIFPLILKFYSLLFFGECMNYVTLQYGKFKCKHSNTA